ncbi:hypodermin-B [Culex quinquefasciatus]|uniref:Hypodermin-B n=1 Tax=Culex quinquefasciatus TaxID=7176 RepID=B0WFK6_CULQU|nr:hypodermin-B [Culex quinquefasciatus]|eukprot:XP_001847490.1 hypodermin-B [Culex quinquefasciatus]
MKCIVWISICLALVTAGPVEDIWLRYNRRMLGEAKATEELPARGRIIGGVETSIENVPYQLSLLRNNFFSCGASVISEQWALSAAHCVYPAPSPHTVTLGGGATNKLDSIIFEVAEIILHPQYDDWAFQYDASLLKTTQPMVGYNIAPIALMPVNEDFPAGTRAVVSGWGVMDIVSGEVSENLRMVSVPIIAQEECQQAWPYSVTDDMLCASEPGRSHCGGDSGGPLVVGGRQIGIVSWGQYGCYGVLPSVFARVSHESIRSFISKLAGV